MDGPEAIYSGAASYDENEVHTDEARRQQECEDFGRALIDVDKTWLVRSLASAAAGGCAFMSTDGRSPAVEIQAFAERHGWKLTLRTVASVL